MQRTSNRIVLLPIVAVLSLALEPAAARQSEFLAPDKLILADGTIIRGMILRNSPDSVLMQKEFHEEEFPKSKIVRIIDHPDDDAYHTEALRTGKLPPWRIIANDLRTNDRIRSVIEIPATLIDVGVFKNVPYKSFLVNRNIELNVYGDPADPAGIELGIYGRQQRNQRLRKMLRGYLAGFLTTREEIGAFYNLDLNGASAQVGNIVLEVTPGNAPDAYGAWWIGMHNPRKLDEVRLSDADYAKITRPHSEAFQPGRQLRSALWHRDQIGQSRRAARADASDRVMLRGFYRAPDGTFRLVTRASN